MKKLKSFFQKNHNFRHWTGILALFALSVGSMQLYHSDWLYTSLLNQPEYVFEGTVSPIQYMLDYSKLESGDRDQDYNSLLAEGGGKMIPHLLSEYNQSNLTFDLDGLDWGNSDHIEKMNLQYNITVPFAGNYKLDSCGIGCGSHPAVDWVTPSKTPLMAASTGKVIKVSEQESGFGHHIVIETENAPHPNDPNDTTTIYFAYSHLEDIYVSEGDIVRVGEIIGLSGETGTATTPHLHWELALEDVPWTPYWPFTWTEASAAGYDFWSGVNEGLGKDNVYKYMADPVVYVNDYSIESYVAPVVVEEEEEEIEEVEEEVIEIDSEDYEELIEEIESDQEEEEILEEEEEEEEIEEVIEEVIVSVATMDIANIEVDMPNFIMTGDKREIEITLYDSTGSVLKDPQFTDDIEISFGEEGIAKLNRNFLDTNDFNKGVATLNLHGELEGSTTIIFEISGSTFTTTPINIINEIQPFAKFGLASDGYFVPNVTEIVQIQALDLSGDPTPKITGSGVVELEIIEGEGTLSPSEVHTDDFKNGIAEVELYTESIDDIIIQVTYGTKVTKSDRMEVQEFTDLSSSHEYYPSVSFLRTKGTISGYSDGSFQPERDVSRVEALKMIYSGMDLPLILGRSVSFKDTASSGEWYSDVLATAAEDGVVQGYKDGSFKPTQGVNRVEFLKMLFASMELAVDPVVTDDPAPDVNNLEWHAPYVQFALDNNIFPDAGSNKNFNPGQAMTRIEVAEVIYRFLVVNHNDEAYSVQLDVPRL